MKLAEDAMVVICTTSGSQAMISPPLAQTEGTTMKSRNLAPQACTTSREDTFWILDSWKKTIEI